MRIEPNSNAGQVAQTSAKVPARTEAQAPTDHVEFDHASALNAALAATPSVRAEEVARAKELVKDPGYPPPYALTRIARLLAMHLDSKDE